MSHLNRKDASGDLAYWHVEANGGVHISAHTQRLSFSPLLIILFISKSHCSCGDRA